MCIIPAKGSSSPHGYCYICMIYIGKIYKLCLSILSIFWEPERWKIQAGLCCANLKSKVQWRGSKRSGDTGGQLWRRQQCPGCCRQCSKQHVLKKQNQQQQKPQTPNKQTKNPKTTNRRTRNDVEKQHPLSWIESAGMTGFPQGWVGTSSTSMGSLLKVERSGCAQRRRLNHLHWYFQDGVFFPCFLSCSDCSCLIN